MKEKLYIEYSTNRRKEEKEERLGRWLKKREHVKLQ